MKQTPDLRPLYRSVKPSTSAGYRQGWKAWRVYCQTVNVDPMRATRPDAEAWVASMRRQGVTPAMIRKLVGGARSTLEYLAMVGYRPHEPFDRLDLPRVVVRARPLPDHDTLTDTRVARALADTRVAPRAHAYLWACAGMGLSAADLANLTPSRLQRVGETTVAIVARAGRGHLVPVPRELLVICVDEWPFTATTGASATHLIRWALQPYISTSAKDLRDYHRDTATLLTGNLERVVQGLNTGYSTQRTRLSWSTHASVAVCEHMRKLLLDIAGR